MFIAQKPSGRPDTDIYLQTNPPGMRDIAELPLGRVEIALPGALSFPTPSSPHSQPETAAA